MAFTFNLTATTLNSISNLLTVTDESVWTDSLNGRNEYGVFIKTEYRNSSTPEIIEFSNISPFTVTSWDILVEIDGRYSILVYAFNKKDILVTPAEGDVVVDVDNLLYIYTNDWVLTTLEDVLDKAVYSGVLEVPVLHHIYNYKNSLLLSYIKQMKQNLATSDFVTDAAYNRIELDYVSALVASLLYNWALSTWVNFYALINNTNSIISSGKLS